MSDFEAALAWAIRKPSEPSKRANRNKSGRAGRRQYNSRVVTRSVGGKAFWLSAIYDGNDRQHSAIEICHVIERDIKVADVGPSGKSADPLYQVPQGQLMGRVGCV